MFAVAVVTMAGWLLLFIVLLTVPPPARPARGEPGQAGRGAEPPAVISLLARRLDRDGFGATVLDLAGRGWFRLDWPAGPRGLGPAGSRGPGPGGAWESAGQIMCVIPAEAPIAPLAPYEQRLVAHVALRMGTHGAVPVAVLADGFQGGKDAFMKAFGGEVAADARERGLTRPRLSPGRIGLLCALLLEGRGRRREPGRVPHRGR